MRRMRISKKTISSLRKRVSIIFGVPFDRRRSNQNLIHSLYENALWLEKVENIRGQLGVISRIKKGNTSRIFPRWEAKGGSVCMRVYFVRNVVVLMWIHVSRVHVCVMRERLSGAYCLWKMNLPPWARQYHHHYRTDCFNGDLPRLHRRRQSSKGASDAHQKKTPATRDSILKHESLKSGSPFIRSIFKSWKYNESLL